MRNNTLSIRALLLVLLFILGNLTGCAGTGTAPEPEEQVSGTENPDSSEPVEPGLARIALSSPVNTMDVQKNTEDYMVPLNIYERLFDIRVNEDGTTRLANGLAEDWSVSDDGRTYHFTLRGAAFPGLFEAAGRPHQEDDSAGLPDARR